MVELDTGCTADPCKNQNLPGDIDATQVIPRIRFAIPESVCLCRGPSFLYMRNVHSH